MKRRSGEPVMDIEAALVDRGHAHSVLMQRQRLGR